MDEYLCMQAPREKWRGWSRCSWMAFTPRLNHQPKWQTLSPLPQTLSQLPQPTPPTLSQLPQPTPQTLPPATTQPQTLSPLPQPTPQTLSPLPQPTPQTLPHPKLHNLFPLLCHQLLHEQSLSAPSQQRKRKIKGTESVTIYNYVRACMLFTLIT